MLELLINGFEIDGYCSQEQSVFDLDRFDFNIYCSKNPQDTKTAGTLLSRDPDQWYIFMVRDGRDAIVSKHNAAPDRYWANLMQWRRALAEAAPYIDHERFITIKYETLTSDPNGIQGHLADRMGFLILKSRFSDFHRTAAPSGQSLHAMRGIRPVSSQNVGAWRKHKPRVVAQLSLHGDISDDLIRLGYELDRQWINELADVLPDMRAGFWNDFPSEAEKDVRETGIWKNAARYLALRGWRPIDQ
ncbi:MAG: sulfotransferase [Kiloniellaceae bacterium]